MRTVTVDTDNKYPASEYFYTNTTGSKAVRNTANFLERNTYTGLRKFPEERTHNEIEALHKVFTGIQMANELCMIQKVRTLDMSITHHLNAD